SASASRCPPSKASKPPKSPAASWNGRARKRPRTTKRRTSKSRGSWRSNRIERPTAHVAVSSPSPLTYRRIERHLDSNAWPHIGRLAPSFGLNYASLDFSLGEFLNLCSKINKLESLRDRQQNNTLEPGALL